MPAPAVWDGSSSGGAQSPAQSPEPTSPAQENTAPASTPAPAQPIASEGAAHNAGNCNGGKKARRGRRAFRQSLRN